MQSSLPVKVQLFSASSVREIAAVAAVQLL